MTGAWALGAVLLFSVLAFGATEQWALSIAQLAIFGIGLAYTSIARIRIPPGALMPAGAALLGVWQVFTGATVYRFVTVNASVNWAAYSILFVLAFSILDRPQVRRGFLRAVVYVGCAIAAVSTAQYFSSNGLIYWTFPVRAGRPFGPFVNPDHYAAFVELIIPVGVYEAIEDRRRLWLYAGMVGVLYGSVIASASRAGVLLCTIELLVLPLLGRRAAIKTFATLTVCAGAALAVGGSEVVWKRFRDEDALRYRREMLQSTWKMIGQRPWTGFGLGSFETVYPEFALFDIGRRVDHAHNDWAEWASEGGIPLLILIAGMVACSFPQIVRTGWGLGVPVVWLHSLVDFPLQIPAIAFLLFTLLGVVAASADMNGSLFKGESGCVRLPKKWIEKSLYN